ncbi:MAG: VOC family protein [Acidobacteriota bacterium]
MSKIQLETKGIAPGLTVNDVAASLKFYTEALGFEVLNRDEHEGVLRFAMLKAGNGSLGIGQDDFAKGRDRAKGVGLRFWIETEQDLQALADQIKAAGYALDSDVEKLPWGPMGFAVTDPDGFKFTISEPQGSK